MKPREAGVLIAVLLAFHSFGSASQTNIWPFTTPGQYTVSDSANIEVAGGVARLKLLAQEQYDASLASYLTNSAQHELLGLGSDVSLVLTKTGPAYNAPGIFTSRVLDGGLGNTWERIQARGFSESFENAGGELTTNTTGIIGLYHLNNDSFRDYVSLVNGTPYNGPTFTTSAKLGAYSGYFDGVNDYVVTPTRVNGLAAYSLCFWVKLRSYVDWGGLVMSRSGSYLHGIQQSDTAGGPGRRLAFWVNSAAFVGVNVIPLNQWTFVVGTWDGSTERMNLYFNGALDTSIVKTTGSTANQPDSFKFGTDGNIANRYSACNLDEVAVFNRVLSATEIYAIYTAPKSLWYQVRSGDSPEACQTNAFTGPDGTVDSYYDGLYQTLIFGGGFRPWERYAQYRAYLYGPRDGTGTPYLDAVGLLGSKNNAFDNTLGDFVRGQFTTNVTTYPIRLDAPYLGLAKQKNGGYQRQGTYTSRVLDGGAAVFWDTLSWVSPQELSISDSSLVGLWHLNVSGADETGHGYNGTLFNMTWTNLAKFGSQAAVFNGSNSVVEIGSLGANSVKTLEFWIRDDEVDDAVLELATNAQICIVVSNRLVTAVGYPAGSTTVYVNGGSTSRKLVAGWNHVVVTTEGTVQAPAFALGRVGGMFMRGQMDEVAVYNRVLYETEIKAHYVSGRRVSAGRPQFQVRADNVVPPGTTFVGPGNDPVRYFSDSPVSLPSDVWNKRYFQYRVLFEGDGNVTPSVDSVTVQYLGGTGFTDDTLAGLARGSFDGDQTKWCGDEAKLVDASVAPGLINVNPVTAVALEGLWHMDESSWGAGASVLDSSSYRRDGQPQNGPQPTVPAKVGAACGSFNGANQYVILPGATLNGDFSVLAWFRSTATTRSAVIARSDQRYMIEFNGDGSGAVPGAVAFVLYNGTTRIPVVAGVGRLNDGAWHHVAGVRQGDHIYIFVDGVAAGAADLGGSFGGLGVGDAQVARHPGLSSYFGGYVDELILYSRALNETEIRQIMAIGGDTKGTGTYVSDVFDAGRPAIWEQIAWREDAPYGDALSAGDLDLVGLWHMDETNGTAVVDSSGQLPPNNGAIVGTVGRTTGRLGGCLSFDGLGGHVEIPDSLSLEPALLSVEAWARPTQVTMRTVFDKSDGTHGYALATDVDGKPYFWIDGTTCKSRSGLQPGTWYHLVGTYDGALARLYINGDSAAVVPREGADTSASAPFAKIGQNYASGGNFSGLIDEAAVHARALVPEEIMDHARAGAARLRVQARASDSSGFEGVNFIGPDGTSNTFFETAWGQNLVGIIPLGRYFQYKAYLSAEDPLRTPRFQGATINQSSYPTDNPWVTPADGYGVAYPGELLGFFHVMATNDPSAVRYQLSGNNGVEWYYYNGDWVMAAGADWSQANPQSVVDANMDTFYDRVTPKTGGTFKFKAFLHSGGNDQVALDEVRLVYSVGRIVVTVPNGQEVNENAWIVGVTNVIQWTSVGAGTNVTIEFSDTSGSTWTPIAPNVPNTGRYEWLTPGGGVSAERTTCRIRVTDFRDSTISDLSDSDFQLAYRYRLLAPNGGEKWYIGDTNVVRWIAAPNLGGFAWLYHNLEGSTSSWVRFAEVPTATGTNNTYAWVTPTTNADILSEQARMRITIQGSPAFADMSDADYTLAGIRIASPDRLTAWKRGNQYTIRWKSSGAGAAGVDIDFSENGGTSWTNVARGVPNVVGSNGYGWVVAANNPTPIAMLRITAREDPRVTGRSDVFTVADIDIKAPKGTNVWRIASTNDILWTAGGAGNTVNIYYSTNDGVAWTLIRSTYTNLDFPATNRYPWVIPPYPGPTRVKVESTLGGGELFAISESFNIGGIRVVSPNGGETWKMGEMQQIRWVQAASGGGCLIEFSYNNGTTYTNIAGPGYPLLAGVYDYVPTFPTVRPIVRISATDAGISNVVDISDNYFTVAGIKVTKPALADAYTMGQAAVNGILWYSAGTLDPGVDVDYAPEDGTATNILSSTFNSETYPGDNVRDWTPAMTVDPSLNGRIRVVSDSVAGSYTGLSARFTVRGVRVTQPNAQSVLPLGQEATISWMNAGMGDGASALFYLSTDGGPFGEPLLPFLVLLDLKAATWPVSPDADPSVNAVVKLVVTNGSVAFQAVSEPFTLRGLKILSPTTGDSWALGTTNTIRFLAARAGSLADIYYSKDGVSYDSVPVAQNVGISNGLNRVTWVVEQFREPSTNAKIRVQSATDTAESRTFTVGGVKVLKPTGEDIWAIGETNRIEWISVGTQGTNTVELLKPGGIVIPIVSGWTETYYDWEVPPEAVGSNVQIRVTDTGGASGLSQPFRIVLEPTIEVISPAAGEYWRVSDTYQIIWTRAGNMPQTFDAVYSFDDFQTFISIPGIWSNVNNRYYLTWTPNDPSQLGPAKIRVTNTDNTNIWDASETFYLVPKFRVDTPNGGEVFYALQPTLVKWYTWGNCTNVDLYYTTDLLRRSNTWVKINDAGGPIKGSGHQQQSQYQWTVADVRSDTVWLRIQDATYPNLYPPTISGPFDDSDGTFAIRYFAINWHVYDRDTSNTLDNLSVSDSSGWSASGLKSDPYVLHEYPYGKFDTVWSREYFFDKVIFGWYSEPSRTIDVAMAKSEISPDYRVMANFLWDATTQVFRVSSWLERAGRVITNPGQCTVSIFDVNGANVTNLVTTSHDANGIFWQTLPSTLDAGKVYFAKVDIEFSGTVYSSGVTFNLRVPTDQEQAAALLAATSNILAGVSAVSNDVTDLATAQAAFRTTTSSQLDSISNLTVAMRGDVATVLTNLDAFSTQSLARLDYLTGAVSVIYENMSTTMQARVEEIAREVGRGSARILTRPLSLKTGSSASILYRTKSGLGPTITIRDPAQTPVVSGVAMPEVGQTGIYEYDTVFQLAWGLGDFTVECTDSAAPDSPTDRIIIKIMTTDLDEIGATLVNVSNRVLNIETAIGALTNLQDIVSILTNVPWDTLSNVTVLAQGITNIYNVVTNIQATIRWSDVTRIMTGVSNLQTTIDWSDITNIYNVVTNVQADTTNILGYAQRIETSVGAMSNLPTLITVLTNVPWDTFSNLTVLAEGITNIYNVVTNVQADTTNILGYAQRIETSVGAMSNLPTLITVLTNVPWDTFSNLTVLAEGITNIYAGVTNLQATIQWSDVTTIRDGVASLQERLDLTLLTNVYRVVTNIQATIDWADVTNILGSAQRTESAINALTNLPDLVAALTNVPWDQITNLTVLAQGITNIYAGVTNLQATIQWSDVTGILTGVSNLQATIQWSDITNILAGVTNVQATTTNILGYAQRIETAVDSLTNLQDVVNVLTNVPWDALTNVAALSTGIADILVGVSNLQATIDWSDVTNIMSGVAELQATMTPENMDTILSGISNLQAAIGAAAALTNVGELAASVEAMRLSVEGMNWAQVTTLETLTSNMYSLVGSPSDSPDAATLFGRLIGVSNTLGGVGINASEAFKKARAASTAAQAAQAGVETLKSELGQGKIDGALRALNEIQAALRAARIAAGQVPEGITTDDILRAMQDAVAQINKLGNLEGIDQILRPMKDWKPVAGGDAILQLNKNIAEMKASVELIGRLMDQTVHKPEFTQWLEGAE